MKKNKITFRSILLGAIFAAVFAVLAIRAAHVNKLYLFATQMPEAPFVLLILMVLLINPICRLIRIIKPFAAVEMLIIFLMGLVSAGISGFGLAHPLASLSGSLFYDRWNNRQTEWTEYVVPFVSETYFVSVPGIQKKALAYHTAFTDSMQTEQAFMLADRYRDTKEDFESARQALEQVTASPETKNNKIKISAAKLAVDNAQRAHSKAQEQWEEFCEDTDIPDLNQVLKTYPERMDQLEVQVQKTQQELEVLQKKAAERVEIFRRGLPPEKRAYPGVFMLPDDDITTYYGRVQRLVTGRAAMKKVRESLVIAQASPPDAPLDLGSAGNIRANIDFAIDKLSSVSDATEFQQRKDRLWEEGNMVDKTIFDMQTTISDLSKQKRKTRSRSESRDIENSIAKIRNRIHSLNRKKASIEEKREKVVQEVLIYENLNGMLGDMKALAGELAASQPPTANATEEKLALLLRKFPSIDASLRRFFLGEVPWSHWIKPLINWGLLTALTYIVLMTFNVLIFRQWAHNEKLTYPLMEIPKAFVADIGDGTAKGLPPIFKNALFWVGIGIPTVVLGWNLICSTNIVPGLARIDLTNSWWQYLSNGKLQAWRNTRSMVFFTAIGLAFLIPKNISFSLWFFHLAYMFILLGMVWAGHGYDEGSFRANWWYIMNFRTSIGAGAIVVFSIYVLYKCKQYLLCVFSAKSVRNLEADERLELRISSFLFLGCSLGLILVLWLGMGANLGYTIFVYMVMIIITIGLVRVVCEGGLLGFKSYLGPFHFIRNLIGLNKAWTSATLFAPLTVFYAVLFVDIKSFIAPAMANSLKIRDDFRMKRGRFHLAIALGIVIAAVISVLVSVMMAYDMGADKMCGWFYSGLPRSTYGIAKTMVKDAPGASESATMWMGIGAGAMGLLLLARQFFFWLPHPLGMIMFINPAMGAYWFSILIGWLANVLITKYAHKETYHRAQGFFIGLIIGELLLVTISAIVSLTMGINPGIDLNRN